MEYTWSTTILNGLSLFFKLLKRWLLNLLTPPPGPPCPSVTHNFQILKISLSLYRCAFSWSFSVSSFPHINTPFCHPRPSSHLYFIFICSLAVWSLERLHRRQILKALTCNDVHNNQRRGSSYIYIFFYSGSESNFTVCYGSVSHDHFF